MEVSVIMSLIGNNRLFDEIVKAIECDDIPKEDYWFSEEFLYEKGYFSQGTLKFKGNIYSFHYNMGDGIFYDTIELKEEE